MYNTSLPIRLLLCAVPPFAAYAPVLVDAIWPYQEEELLGSIFLGVYGWLIGVCVLIQYVELRSASIARVTFLTIVPALAILSLKLLDTGSIFEQLGIWAYLNAGLFGAYVSTIIGAALVVLLRMAHNRRFWPYVLCSGALSGVGVLYYLDVFFCLHMFGSTCPEWYDWMVVPALMLFPITFCLAAFFGQLDGPGSQRSYG